MVYPLKRVFTTAVPQVALGTKTKWQGSPSLHHMAPENNVRKKWTRKKSFHPFNTLPQSRNCGTQGQSKTWKAIFPERSFAAKLLAPHHPSEALPFGGDLRGWLETANQLPSSGDLGTCGVTPTPEWAQQKKKDPSTAGKGDKTTLSHDWARKMFCFWHLSIPCWKLLPTLHGDVRGIE